MSNKKATRESYGKALAELANNNNVDVDGLLINLENSSTEIIIDTTKTINQFILNKLENRKLEEEYNNETEKEHDEWVNSETDYERGL